MLFRMSPSKSLYCDDTTIILFCFRYQFSETGAHGSIIVVGDDVAQYNQVVLRLDNNLTYADFRKAIDAMPYMGYRTRMDLGFKLANEVVFQERYGQFQIVTNFILISFSILE